MASLSKIISPRQRKGFTTTDKTYCLKSWEEDCRVIYPKAEGKRSFSCPTRKILLWDYTCVCFPAVLYWVQKDSRMSGHPRSSFLFPGHSPQGEEPLEQTKSGLLGWKPSRFMFMDSCRKPIPKCLGMHKYSRILTWAWREGNLK